MIDQQGSFSETPTVSFHFRFIPGNCSSFQHRREDIRSIDHSVGPFFASSEHSDAAVLSIEPPEPPGPAGLAGQMSDPVGPEHLEAAAGDPTGLAVDLAAGHAAIAATEGSAYPGLAVGPATVGVETTAVERAVSVEVYHSVVGHAETEGSQPEPRACWEVGRNHAAEYVGRAVRCLPGPAALAAVLALAGERTSVAAGGFAAGRGVPDPEGASG